MSDGISAWHDDEDDYDRLCEKYDEKRQGWCYDEHAKKLAEREYLEKLAEYTKEIKKESANDSNFRWSFNYHDEIIKIDITKDSCGYGGLYNTREEAVAGLKKRLQNRVAQIRKNLNEYYKNEEDKITRLEFLIDTLK